MNDAALQIRHRFEQLPATTATDRAILHAFERMTHGAAQCCDGSLTVVNVCLEAAISRATYYRSPMAAIIKQVLAAPEILRPETDQLKTENTRLRREQRQLRQDHAREIADPPHAIACYANHNQILNLRNTQLESDNAALLAQLNDANGNVIALPAPR